MSKREKFQTRNIILAGESQKELAEAMIRNAPLGIEIVAREIVKARGLDANGYYWLRLGEIANQAWLNGRQFSSDCWHEYAKRNLMPEEVTTKDGATRPKWLETPDGVLTVISTTQLERRCFADYTSAVEAFGASLGVLFSANPRERMAA